jgi:hypothetical protein
MEPSAVLYADSYSSRILMYVRAAACPHKYDRDLPNPFTFLFRFIIRPLEDPWHFGDRLFTEVCVISHMRELLTTQDITITFASSEGII